MYMQYAYYYTLHIMYLERERVRVIKREINTKRNIATERRRFRLLYGGQ